MAFLGMVGGASTAPGMYRAGVIGQELGDASVRTLGCLDVGLAIIERPNAGSLLQLDVGNRCSHPEALDFSKVRISGSEYDHQLRTVALEDPRHEIVELHVGAGERGRELVRLENAHALLHLSFEVDEIAPDAPHAHPAAVYFTRQSADDPWTAVL